MNIERPSEKNLFKAIYKSKNGEVLNEFEYKSIKHYNNFMTKVPHNELTVLCIDQMKEWRLRVMEAMLSKKPYTSEYMLLKKELTRISEFFIKLAIDIHK